MLVRSTDKREAVACRRPPVGEARSANASGPRLALLGSGPRHRSGPAVFVMPMQEWGSEICPHPLSLSTPRTSYRPRGHASFNRPNDHGARTYWRHRRKRHRRVSGLDAFQDAKDKRGADQNITSRVFKELEKIPHGNQVIFARTYALITESISDACDVLNICGIDFELENFNSLSEICAAGISKLPGTVTEGSEPLHASKLTFLGNQALLESLTQSPLDLPGFGDAMYQLGRANVRMRQVSSGMWNIIADADRNDSIAKGVKATRSAGGKAAGQEKQAKAAEWKAKALPVAQKLVGSNPSWTRGKLAAEIVYHFDWKTPGSRQVENWLKDEAEAPRGPLPSRARRNSEHR
jgi:hypothetical protein